MTGVNKMEDFKLEFLKEDQRLFLERGYLDEGETPEERFYTIAETVKKYSVKNAKTKEALEYVEDIDKRFLEYFSKGWVSLSTPVLKNFGKKSNLPISCNFSILEDSLDDIYKGLHETGMLAKNGAGTAVNFSNIRPAGSTISTGGKSNTVLDWVELYADMMSKTAQNCYKDDVEVLTDEGWKLFKDLNKSEKIASVLPNGEVIFDKPLDYLVTDYKGNLIKLKDSKNINISVTPNHNLVTINLKKIKGERSLIGDTKLETAENVKFNRDKFMTNSAKLAGSRKLTNLERFYIAYQADGSVSSKNTVRFHFSKERKVERLISILDSIGFKYTVTSNTDGTVNVRVNSLGVPSKLFDWVNLNEVDANWGREFLEELSEWDSYKSPKNSNSYFNYFSTEKFNIDVVQSICAISSYKSYVTEKEGEHNVKKLYNIAITNKKFFGTEKLRKELEYYEGKVYCVTMNSGRIIVRSGGRTLVCGNSARRGFLTAYLSVDHPEIMDFLDIGTKRIPKEKQRFFQTITTAVTIPEGWRDDLKSNPKKREIFTKILNTRKECGFPYILDLTNANENKPQVYKDKNMRISSSNICIETSEFADSEKTFACCLSSVNLYWWDDFKNDPNFIFDMNLLLDAVIEEYIEKAKHINGFQKAVKFAEEHRSIGLGVTALATLYQKKMLPFGSIEASILNRQIFKTLRGESDRASKWMATHFGEPLILKGYGERNTTRIAQAPKKSTTFIDGGTYLALSEGIEPHKSNYSEKKLAKIQVEFKNQELVKLLESKGKNTKEVWDSILVNNGSVQHLEFLTDHEKDVFKIFSEISQIDIIDQASARQKYIDQGQSVNLMIHPETPAKDIINIHLYAFEKGLKSLYYQYSINASQRFNQKLMTCSSCEG